MSQSTKAGRTRKSQQKPKKPRPDYPLFAHQTGRWCKKIRGRHYYFGPWDDPDAALQKYLDEKDDLHAGRTPRVTGDGPTIADLCNRFLAAKQQLLDIGELALNTWNNYHGICEMVVSGFGKHRRVDDLTVNDFARLRAILSTGKNGNGKLSPTTIGQRVRLVSILFKYAFDVELVEKPVRFGPDFKAPPKRKIRKARQERGKRMFEADEIRSMLDAAKQPMKAMILLACNGGLGQSDLANMPKSAVGEAGWLDYPQPKTAVERRIPLWAETVEALREAIACRPQAKDAIDDELCFITQTGQRWVRNSAGDKRAWVDSVGMQFKKLIVSIDINGRRNFYALKHGFETIAGESRDQVAVNALMGHAGNSMAGVYRERISDERLKAVVDVVHNWLFE